ncbi:CRISPR-associated protein Cas3 [Ralstonia solanacearum]|uniref:CRISPR-associated helicase/endonuclease Cas3 n=1 Tax=Ralstonia solanacearum TaxID=305 RepID=UPI0007D7B028|nr:CRISPR-associated helicase/endonuclease Cas3 [Ralstonia solanacearum]OAI64385.1 CRISPR-associated protein Cas3 [Ralstonia solanacearum]
MEKGAAQYFAYWGKARIQEGTSQLYHLLVFHALDVAACGAELLRLPRFSLAPLAAELGWPLRVVEKIFIWFLALHDLGKFARAFQNLAPGLSPDLVSPDPKKQYLRRHDTLGWLLWQERAACLGASLPDPVHGFWAAWVQTAVGHHGMPPQDTAGGGLLPLQLHTFYLPEDMDAAVAFANAVAPFLLPSDIPVPGRAQRQTLLRHAWRLAGLAVLADWLGSNQEHFRYCVHPQDLSVYWREVAQPAAARAVCMAGLSDQAVSPWQGSQALFPYLVSPTPLQQYAETVPLAQGPQLFLLEDVTGAGKTEAAMMLAHRLMAAGHAHGIYFALPSMATANQIYRRTAAMYRRLYQAGTAPSLVLSHGARQLVDDFRSSVLERQAHDDDFGYGREESSASAQCSAWLADNRKKALLADVGVGTLDQALLAVLPARHQSLRLLGLSGKVLLVDEVHAYDSYMHTLLCRLLTAHARQSGSVLLLSATLPTGMRAELVAAFQAGCGREGAEPAADTRYPLATHVHAEVSTHACATRPQLVRKVAVAPFHAEQAAVERVIDEARAGRCICWIRNTVDDARHAFMALQAHLPAPSLALFHSRFAMGDRLAIEAAALDRFGKASTAVQRRGQVLIATQVVEQSLDLDFDIMISDLAPIDLLIQRAGRLQRHARHGDGEPAADGCERRPAPTLYLLCPENTDTPASDWYAALLPKARHVYPDVGKLWLTQRALLAAGQIVSPGGPGEDGAVRSLVEAVYGAEANSIPDALQPAAQEREGKDMAAVSQAHFNALNLERGYCIDSSRHWDEDTKTPTRLSDETCEIYLAREEGGELVPFVAASDFPWEHAAVRVRAGTVGTLSECWQARFGPAIDVLRKRHRLLADPALVLPLVQEDGRWVGYCERNGKPQRIEYDDVLGLRGF